ncbi:MAG TPA: hypothetical protein DDZ41_00135 [Flavobacterium sp.]|nr:hypothetical protein [Flavobacterium sp.]
MQKHLFNILSIVFLFSFQIGYSQDEEQDDEIEIITHRVELGETMLMISKKYLVQPSEIYKLNKKSINGVHEGMVLSIPQHIKSKEIIQNRLRKREKEILEEKTNSEVIKPLDDTLIVKKWEYQPEKNYCDHLVIAGETLTSIGKLYGITIQDIKNENEKLLAKGLKNGMVLSILIKEESIDLKEPTIIPIVEKKEISENNTSKNTHVVKNGETLFGIAKKYNISIKDLESQNRSTLAKGLQTGMILEVLTIQNPENPSVSNPTTDKNEISVTSEVAQPEHFETLIHKVASGETLYSISKKYSISVEEIQNLNSKELKNGLKAGQEIVIKLKK